MDSKLDWWLGFEGEYLYLKSDGLIENGDYDFECVLVCI